MREAITTASKHRERERLKDLWNAAGAARVAGDPLSLLRYRSNLLGADLRITNFGGGNTSSKVELPDPLTGEPVRVMAVKGSGGDLRSIDNAVCDAFPIGTHFLWHLLAALVLYLFGRGLVQNT